MTPAAATPSTASPRLGLAPERHDSVVLVPHGWKREAEPHHAARIKAGIDPLQAKEAVGQQAGAEQKWQGERNSAMTSAPRIAFERRLKPPRAGDDRTPADTGERREKMAVSGARLTRTPLNSATAVAKAMLRPSRATSERRGRPGATTPTRPSVVTAMASPAAPAMSVSTTHSVRISRMTR